MAAQSPHAFTNNCWVGVKTGFLAALLKFKPLWSLLALVLRGCWTVSCRPQIALTLLAYRSPSGSSSSSPASPLINLGLSRLSKVQPA